MNISEISGTMVSDPSTATNQIIVDTGDGLQRAIATSAVSGTIVSEDSIETTDCIVDTGSGLQRAIKTAGGGGGGTSTKYGASVDNFLGDVDANGVLQAPTEEVNVVFTGVKDIVANGLKYKWQNSSNIKSASFPNLTSITGTSCLNLTFQYSSLESISFPELTSVSAENALNNSCSSASNLTAVSFPKLSTINGQRSFYQAFLGTGVTSASFPELTSISGNYACSEMFSSCSSLSSISFPKLTSVSGYGLQYAFRSTAVTSVTFPALSSINAYYALAGAFQMCTSLTSISFPALVSNMLGRSQFSRMLDGCTGVTVHFPSNLQSVIGSWSDVTAGFGGTNTTVLFDLPATE